MTARDPKFPAHWGGTVHCVTCNADTTVGERKDKIHDLFGVQCAYCQFIELAELRDAYAEVVAQRDALAKAIDIKRTLVRAKGKKP